MADYEVYARADQINRDEWLELRRGGIGGSDAGAIMGVSPYKSAFSVYADKMGFSAAEDNEAMRQGRDLEEYVARRFSETTGKKVRREYGMLRSLRHPCMVANIDRRIVGERAGLECKTSRDLYMKRYRNGDYPMEYYCQILHYLAVTGWDKWYLAVLVYGTDLKVFEICREDVQDDIDALIQAEEAFWHGYIEGGKRPPTDGMDSTTNALDAMYGGEQPGSWIDADGEAEQRIVDLAELMAEKKQLEKRIEEMKNALKAAMGETEELRGSRGRVTWKTQKRRSISEKLLRAAIPGFDTDTIKTETSSRVFKLMTMDDESQKG